MDKVLSNVVLVETLHNLQIHLAELKKKFFLPLVLANYFQLHPSLSSATYVLIVPLIVHVLVFP